MTVKVALVSIDGEIVASEQEALEVTLLPGGGAEQDPERWWSLVTRASSRLMGQAPVPPESVVAVRPGSAGPAAGLLPAARPGQAPPDRPA